MGAQTDRAAPSGNIASYFLKTSYTACFERVSRRALAEVSGPME